jgi:hypothetical protein
MKWHAVLLRSSRKNIKNNMKIQPWILPFKLSGQLLTKKKPSTICRVTLN